MPTNKDPTGFWYCVARCVKVDKGMADKLLEIWAIQLDLRTGKVLDLKAGERS